VKVAMVLGPRNNRSPTSRRQTARTHYGRTVVLQRCFNIVRKVVEGCYSGVTMVLK
jgi:hypothetical protein